MPTLRERIDQIGKRLINSRIFRDSTAMAIANYCITGLAMATSIVLARELGVTNYGLIHVGMALVNTVTQFMDIRTDEGMIRFMGNALARDEQQEAINFFVVGLSADAALMLVTFIVASLVVPLAARAYPDPALIRTLAGIYVFSIPFTTLQGSFTVALHIFKRFTLLAIANIVIALVRFALLVALAPFGYVAVMWGYMAATGVSFVVFLVLGSILLRKHLGSLWGRLRGMAYKDAWRQFLPFAFHTSVTASLKALSSNIDVLLLGALHSSAAVSYFQIARSAAGLIALPTAPISNVIYPEMNEAWAKKNMKRVRRLIGRFMLASLAVGVVLWTFLFFTADWLVEVFYTVDFLPAGALIPVIGLGVVLESLFRWARPTAMSQNKPQLITFYGVASMVLRIGLLVPLIYYMGAMGSALAYDLVVVFNVLMIVFYVSPRLDLWHPFGKRSKEATPGS